MALIPDGEPVRTSWRRAQRMYASQRSLSRGIALAIADELEVRGVTEADIDAMEQEEGQGNG